MIIDSHLHIWSNDRTTYPWAVQNPAMEPLDGSAEHLLALMEEAGVTGALVVQPILYKFDHTYVNEWLRRLPDRFVGMCLADPADPNAADEVERLVRAEGYRGVRINPLLYPEGAGLDSEITDRLLVKVAELGIVAGFLIQPEHFSAIEALLQRHPDAKVVLDHFGHCHTRDGVEDNPDMLRLIRMAEYSNLYIKLSEFERASQQKWPYRDVQVWVHQLLEAFGPQRLMWASDFPLILDQCGYRPGLTLLTEETPGIPGEAMEWLLGKTAQQVFGGWGAA